MLKPTRYLINDHCLIFMHYRQFTCIINKFQNQLDTLNPKSIESSKPFNITGTKKVYDDCVFFPRLNIGVC